MRAVLALVILLFLLGHTLAVAPGDEDDECAVQNYTSKTRVLLDSWRYQTLLADDTTMSVWTTYNNDSNENGVWSSVGGTCEDGVVAVCPGNITKVLETQVIKKSLPAPDEYPVTVFVQISYSISCPIGSDCDFELQLILFDGIDQHSVSLQNNRLPENVPIYTIQFTASSNDFDQFKLSIVAHPSSGCIEVKRVLVFLIECPSQQSNDGLGLLPATQAPDTGSVSVTPRCVENSDLSLMSAKGVQCTSDGTWVNDETLCVCNRGYYNDNGVCRAVMVYNVSENQVRVEVCFYQEIDTNLTFEITTRDVTAISNFDYYIDSTNTFFLTGSQCTSIVILPDRLSEGEESFDVVVMREDNNMILSYATVYISRNTGSGSSCTEGSVSIVSNVFNNVYQLVEMCSSEGVWSPVCDIEWTIQDATVVCRELGYSSWVSHSVLDSERFTNMIVNCNGTENNLKSCFSQITNTTPCSHLLVYCKDPLPTVFTSGGQTQTLINTASNKPHQTSISNKHPINTATHDIILHQTPIITASNTPHLNNTAENDDDGGIPIAAIAGLCVAIVISIIIILIVILLIVLLSKKSNRKLQSKKPSETAESETCKDLSNPVYDSTTQGNICRSRTTEASNRQETASSPTLHNPLYTLPVHPTDNTSSGQPLNGYYEDPEYSVPKVGYETPVNTPSPQPPIRHVYDYAALDTSPTESPSPQPPTHMYDYAVIPPSTHALVPPTTAPEYAVVPPTTAPEYAVVPPTTAPDYAILESNEHTYHYLESNELSSQQQQQQQEKGLQSGSRDIYHSQGRDAEYSKLVHK